MNENVYKKVEVIGSSEMSIEAAINNAVERANNSLRNLRWFEVKEVRGSIDEGSVKEWQVGLNLAFSLDSKSSVQDLDHNAAGRVAEDPDPLVRQTEPAK